MLNKSLLTTLLLLLTIICSVGFINVAYAATHNAKVTPSHQIQVYYLHNTFRCSSCNSIGDLTQAAVLGGKVKNPQTGEEKTIAPAFQALIDQRKLSFTAVNVDDTENHHLLKEFHTRSKFPVVVELKDGKVVRYKVLGEVWNLLHGPQEKFINYIQKSVKEYTRGL